MLNKITAAAISTVLSLNTAIPCFAECSEEQTEETYAAIAASAVFADTDEADTDTTPEAPTQAAPTVSEPSTETVVTEEPEDEEPVEEGSLGITVSYRLYEDGTLYISGRGLMDNYSRSPFKSPELIKKAIVSNKDGTIFTIGSSVFSDCTELKEIVLPSTLITIESGAFANCASLSLVQFEGAAPAVDGELVISESIEDIKESAFSDCTSLESVIVPETTMSVGKSAFSGCTSLKKAVIKGGSAKIGEYIFNRCASLEEITLPFAGYSAETVNAEGSNEWLGFMFGDAVVDGDEVYTYGVKSFNGYMRHIPKSLVSVTITGGQNIPSYAFDGFSSLKTIVIPDDIKNIGDVSFRTCDNLTDFVIPSAVISIGDDAFAYCRSISAFDIPEGTLKIGSSAFLGCSSIREMVVPESVEFIGKSAFSSCTALNKAVIKGENVEIGEYIFNRCVSLEEITLPFAGFSAEAVNGDDSTAWLGFMFGESVVEDETEYTYGVRSFNGYVRHIPRSLVSVTITGGQKIPSYAFDGFSSLKTMVIPDDIKNIGDASFRNCTALTDFVMPSEILSIGNDAFAGCEGISAFDIPEGTLKIGSSAFLGCSSIREMIVPESVEFIGKSAFSGCTALNKAVIKGENVEIGEYIFNRCVSLEEITIPFAGYSAEAVNGDDSTAWLGFMFGEAVSDESGEYTYGIRSYNGYVRHIPKSLVSVTITGGQNIPSYAFDGFSSLKTIIIPDDIKNIGDASFRNCTALTDFEMPSALTSVGNEAFINCGNISDIVIPRGVTKIGSRAFENCTSITEIIVPKATEIIGDSAFAGCTSLRKAIVRGGSKKLGEHIFSRCVSLEDLTVPFTAFSEDAANTEGSRAWLGFMFGDAVYDEAGEYTYGVRSYNGYVCHIPKTLKNITFLDGEYMAGNLLQGFSSVENVTLPKDIKEIGDSAFDGCENIESVFYPDTEEAWADVNIKEKNESIDGKVIFFVKGPLGDTNEDGIIDAADASNILALYAESSTGGEAPTDYEYSVYDVNGDGIIDSTDASLVLSYYSFASTSDTEITLEEFLETQKNI